MKVLVTGANRGIGLGFVRRYLKRGDEVIATARAPQSDSALADLIASSGGRGRLLPLDVASPESVCDLAEALDGEVLDVLINNAGMSGASGTVGSFEYGLMARQFETNALGTLRITEAMWPALSRGDSKRVVQISSRMGSISDNTSGGGYGYRMSKAALNMANRSLSLDLASHGIVAVVLHPGWVKTDMGGPNALIDVETSVSGMMSVIDGLGADDNGRFINWDGEEIPW